MKFPSWNSVLTMSKEEFLQAMSSINKTAEKHATGIYTLAEELKGTPLPSHGEIMKVQYLIPLIQETDKNINDIDKNIEEILDQKHKDGHPNLQAIKGIGQVTESKILAETGTISRFKRYKNFNSYGGVIPVPDDSADTKKERKPKRNCNGKLRATILSGTVSLIHHNPTFRALYVSKLHHLGSTTKDTKRRARLYIANKFSRIVSHLLKTKEPYDEKKMLAC